MRTTFSSLCLVILLSFLHQNPAKADLIDQTCGAANVLYKDLCQSTLRADPASKSADIHGLASIALAAASADVKVVRRQIAELLKSTSERFALGALRDCDENYSSAGEEIDESGPAMNERRYDDVNNLVSAAMTDADSCEDGFKQGTSKLTQANEKFGHLCSNVLAISNQAA